MSSPTDAAIGSLLAERSVQLHFMPVVDVLTGSVFAFELVARGVGELELPAALFAAANAAGRRRELDELCRDVALESIARLPGEQKLRWKFFVNTSLQAFLDPAFRRSFEPSRLGELGIPPDAIIIELTDKEAIGDVEKFEAAALDASRRGLRLALDDFGSQQAGLLQLVASTPYFIKLDRRLVHQIAESNYRQMLVRTVVQFAGTVDTRISAEGVETLRDMDTLLRLGIRFMQGYFFGRPAPVPTIPPAEVMAACQKRVRRFLEPGVTDEARLGSIATQPTQINANALTISELDQYFLSNSLCDHVVILKSGQPVGLMTRHGFYASLAGPGSMELMGRMPVDVIADPGPLVLDVGVGILAAAQVAMNRLPEHFHDPILLRDAIGGFAGSISVRTLLSRALDIEVQRARDTNPLTGLPGNRAVEQWIAQAYALEGTSLLYADLNHFKAFNSAFGFLRGDDLLRVVARLLSSHFHSEETRVGHIGGDDFVVFSRQEIDEATLDAICRGFDDSRSMFFSESERARGSFSLPGTAEECPLPTLVLAVIPRLRVPGGRRVGDLAPRVARLKQLVKQRSAERRTSSWMAERAHDEPA